MMKLNGTWVGIVGDIVFGRLYLNINWRWKVIFKYQLSLEGYIQISNCLYKKVIIFKYKIVFGRLYLNIKLSLESYNILISNCLLMVIFKYQNVFERLYSNIKLSLESYNIQISNCLWMVIFKYQNVFGKLS